MWSPLVRQANDFLPFSITEPHLLVILSKWGADWIFVNSLYNTYDFSITVADGHTEDGLSLVPGQLVNLITEAVILELWSYKHTGYYIFIDRSPHLKHTHTHPSSTFLHHMRVCLVKPMIKHPQRLGLTLGLVNLSLCWLKLFLL